MPFKTEPLKQSLSCDCRTLDLNRAAWLYMRLESSTSLNDVALGY